jgi:deazaflavin-dependent oxidoreductase (nitroreductase family)
MHLDIVSSGERTARLHQVEIPGFRAMLLPVGRMTMTAEAKPQFIRPTPFAALFNRLLGVALSIGFAPKGFYLVEVKGRSSGKLYATPVSIIERDGIRYLVAPRGNTQWVRNARSAGAVALRVGSARQEFVVTEIRSPSAKASLLKQYLATYTRAVQQFFTVQNGAPEAEFAAVADQYPVFELKPVPSSKSGH